MEKLPDIEQGSATPEGQCPEEQRVNDAIRHISDLLNARSAPELPDQFAANEGMCQMHERMLSLRDVLASFARGDLTTTVSLPGYAGGALKSLQAHLRHLTWQVQQVEQGDFTQRVDFLGEFSTAFNRMIERLDSTLTQLRQKEAALTRLTRTLRNEVELRSSAVMALRQSESKFKYLAEHDPLTDTLNRRSFLSQVTGEMRAAALTEAPFCVALLDVDHFKRFNDTYGHLAGDEALRHLVHVASAGLRHVDIMGRYGGEEFIFFFSGADLEQGMGVAERIRRTVEESPVLVQVEGEDKSIPITCSIGVCVVLPEWPGERDDFFLQTAINCADQALYKAKEEGRNRVVAAPPEPFDLSRAPD